MRRILLISIWSFFAVSYCSQVASARSNPEVDVYILVDASGSMKSGLRKPEAESKLAAAFELFDRDAQVSVTFFGGALEESGVSATCDDTIVAKDPKPKGDGVPSFPQLGGGDGETSLGNALLAALQHGGADANIILITDGVEECDSDFVGIRREYPMANISVHQVGDSPNTALNLLEVQSRHLVLAPSLPNPLPIQIHETKPKPSTRPGGYLFLEKWLWLMGFLVISLNAMVLGLRRASKSVELERDVKKFERLQADVQSGQNDSAKELLNTHIHAVDENIKKEKQHYRFWPIVGRYVFGGSAIVALVFLATLSPQPNPSRFDLSSAQQSAWTVLNSDFATAFAVTWIALLFFYGSQSQRRRDALKDLEIATESANRMINEKRFGEFQTYETQRNAVRSILTTFKGQREHLVYLNDDDASVDLSSEYDFALQEMERVALGDALERSRNNDEDAALYAEVRKLKTLIEGSVLMFSQEATLPRFIERLIETKKIERDVMLWRAYGSAVKSSNGERVRLCLRNLTEKLRES